ncbi:MAG TPA: PA0069 family radical SAM protein [Steroidobacteraceae bacterium]|nr:PA0069 family radical SAM protein [Steroidobacteraceae bacterium]
MDLPIKGRGAPSNRSSRFLRLATDRSPEFVDDAPADEAPPPRHPATRLHIDATRTIISRNDSPDVPFGQSINPYRGCEHGCVYCFARPSHAYLDHSPGLDFETQIYAKPDAARLLDAELRRPGYRPDTIHLGANTDPYQPLEREARITRQILEKLLEFGHPVTVLTKGALIERDLDLLGALAARGLARAAVSITTLDSGLKRTLEPRAASPAARLRAVAALVAAGVPTSVLVAPVIPAVNDHELEAILEAARAAGARRAGWILLRLPRELRELMKEWLAAHRPLAAARVMSLVRGTRRGRESDPRFHARMRGDGAYAELIERRFAVTARRLGLEQGRQAPLDTSQFRVPAAGGQLALL